MTDPQPPLRILLVEDSAEDAELVSHALRDGGLDIDVRVVEEETGLRAELAGFLPDVLVIDWNLPEYSAAAALALARAWDPYVPCILVSGSMGEELVVEAMRIGATDYVLKHRLEALVPAVRRAVGEGAGRRETARLEAELAATQVAMRGALDAMTDPFAICTAVRDASGAISDFIVLFANRAGAAFVGASPEDAIGRSFRTGMPVAIGEDFYEACVQVVATRERYQVDALEVTGGARAGAGTVWIDLTVEAFHDGFFVVFRDVTERTLVARERDRLAAVVEDSADGITIADPGGLAIYANGAFQELVGLPLAEIVGQPTRLLAARVLTPETIAWLSAQVSSADPVRREVELQLAGGPARRAELAVNTRTGADGAISSIVTVIHDVTVLREAQADLALQADVRLRVAEVLRGVRDDTTLGQAAQMICDQLVELPNIDQASIDIFLAPDELQVIGTCGPSGFPLVVGDHLPEARAALIHDRLQSGPWAWYATDDPTGNDWAALTVQAGLRALAYGPITFGDELVGALVMGTYSDPFARTLVEKLPAIASFSSTSSGLLASRMQAMRREASLRRSLEAMIEACAFHPVFQPIVDLESREILGYEALTRFDSGQRPDLCFADAHSVGLGPRLETATLKAALASAASLPGGLWLSLNISPMLLVEAAASLRPILRSADRPLVIEVTEHHPIADYAAVRNAVHAVGRRTRLAVDDAGVGVANLNHIIELRPDFVKLDISLVRGISHDLGRQAMVVGLQHFARTAGCRLIAEGVETRPEASTLRRLGIEFGQGYLFGRPEPAGAWLAAVPKPAARRRARGRDQVESAPAPVAG